MFEELKIRTLDSLNKSWSKSESWMVWGNDGIRYYVKKSKCQNPENVHPDYLIKNKEDLVNKLKDFVKDRTYTVGIFNLNR
jgi:hypothetical protein